LAAYKLDRSKPVQDHLGLVDRMLVGVWKKLATLANNGSNDIVWLRF
jgi:hypothetical protein